jgi:flagellar biosynthesis/type III secretory pathway protein FliH
LIPSVEQEEEGGREEGKKEGREEGRKEGRKGGREGGRKEGKTWFQLKKRENIYYLNMRPGYNDWIWINFLLNCLKVILGQ